MKKIKIIEIDMYDKKELIYSLFQIYNLTEKEKLIASDLLLEFESHSNGIGKTEGKKIFLDEGKKDIFKKLLKIGIIEKIKQENESKYQFTNATKIIIQITTKSGAETNSPKSTAPQEKSKTNKNK